MAFKAFWDRWHNKFLALLFGGLGALAYVLYYGILIGNCLSVGMALNDIFSSPLELLSIVINLAMFYLIIAGNAKNNNIAYVGILMFVFGIFIEEIIDFIKNPSQFVDIFTYGDVLTIGLWIFKIARVVIGIMLYVNVFNYINYRSENFIKVRVLGIVFACLLLPELLLEIIPMAIVLPYYYSEPEYAWYILELVLQITLLSFSDLCIAVCSIFTVERIRRF